MNIKTLNGDLGKVAMFTDIHFGKKQNDVVHNHDCLDFIDWFIEKSTKLKVDSVVFLGDYFDNRLSLGLQTMVARKTWH